MQRNKNFKLILGHIYDTYNFFAVIEDGHILQNIKTKQYHNIIFQYAVPLQMRKSLAITLQLATSK